MRAAARAAARPGQLPALGELTHALLERVEVAVGLAQVPAREDPDHEELRQREGVADRDAVPDELAAHEVLRVAREQDEGGVPDEEEGGRGDHPAALGPDELLELVGALERLVVVGHLSPDGD